MEHLSCNNNHGDVPAQFFKPLAISSSEAEDSNYHNIEEVPEKDILAGFRLEIIHQFEHHNSNSDAANPTGFEENAGDDFREVIGTVEATDIQYNQEVNATAPTSANVALQSGINPGKSREEIVKGVLDKSPQDGPDKVEKPTQLEGLVGGTNSSNPRDKTVFFQGEGSTINHMHAECDKPLIDLRATKNKMVT